MDLKPQINEIGTFVYGNKEGIRNQYKRTLKCSAIHNTRVANLARNNLEILSFVCLEELLSSFFGLYLALVFHAKI